MARKLAEAEALAPKAAPRKKAAAKPKAACRQSRPGGEKPLR
jgi:hypothetical protein